MSQEVSKRLISGLQPPYIPFISRLSPIYKPFTNFLGHPSSDRVAGALKMGWGWKPTILSFWVVFGAYVQGFLLLDLLVSGRVSFLDQPKKTGTLWQTILNYHSWLENGTLIKDVFPVEHVDVPFLAM